MTVYRGGKPSGELSGATLTFQTVAGETVVAVPAGSAPTVVKFN